METYATKEDVARLEAKLDEALFVLRTVAKIATRGISRTELAKRAGCSKTTLWRRERRARVELIKKRLL